MNAERIIYPSRENLFLVDSETLEAKPVNASVIGEFQAPAQKHAAHKKWQRINATPEETKRLRAMGREEIKKLQSRFRFL